MGEISPYHEIGNLKLCPRDEGFSVVRDLGQVRYICARFLAWAALIPGTQLEVGNTGPVSHHKWPRSLLAGQPSSLGHNLRLGHS